MKTMETAAKLLFQSINSIYGGTISSSALNPNLYFKDSNSSTIYYGIRLHNIIPTRLITRIYTKRNTTVVDLLWLVDKIDTIPTNCVVFSRSKKNIDIQSSSKEFKSLLEKDANIQACYEDLVSDEPIFDQVLIGSKGCYFQKTVDYIGLVINNISTDVFAITRCYLQNKKMKKQEYRNQIINNYLAIIDLVHRSIELNCLEEKEKKGIEQYCIRCGYSLPDSSYFCPFCGTKQD